tara:strand:- start:1596 stop:4223 length:2628 start_codon:yes stop_codon:yes gene_type:complete
MKNSSAEIRSKFIDYFTSKGHIYVDSSPIIPPNDDKTLLFTNAGMVQFKDIFLGIKDSKYKSAVTSQKCIRAGGKHNDLDNVGFTNRHHTFFEMLGNFSFGDYFKRDAISYAWGFLTNELSIPKEKLWVTVHDTDSEAKDIWLNDIGIEENKISVISTNDNFWSMGDVGPCGPCTEIFYDFGSNYEGNPPGHGDEGERYVEIWNLVFMQFNRLSKDKIVDLPKPSVDTGMGLERICAVMQNEHSNYDTDLFAPIINFIKDNTQKKYHSEISSMKVIADHIRSISFLVTEGVRPSNEGHGYVLRRIIRRAVRHSHKINLEKSKFLDIVPIFINTLKNQYKDINQYDLIKDTLSNEIEKFIETLDTGLEILDKNIKKIISKEYKKEISGELLFLLYDTYGFPIDLTSTIAEENNFIVDLKSFEILMNQQKINSKRSNKFDTKNAIDLLTNHETYFTGYHDYENKTKILDIYIDGSNTEVIKENQEGCIIIDTCPFYAESGGQIGDSGIVFSDFGKFKVFDTQKYGVTNLLFGKQVEGSFKSKDEVLAKIDSEKRNRIKINHSATHLLHSALIKNIDNNVKQKGSLVSDEKLRFDFSCDKALNKMALRKIEDEVNNNIDKNISSKTQIMNKDQAIEEGAMALFGEKYDDEVRVLSFGDISTELCGGTHVNNTGDIGVFKILSESSVSSGIRRIEAITGMSANDYLKKRDNLVSDICQVLNVQDEALKNKINTILEDNKKLKKQNSNLLKEIHHFKILKNISDKNLILGFNVHVFSQDYVDGKVLKNILEDIKSSEEKLIITILQQNNNKLEIYTLVTKDCLNFITAKDVINTLNENIGSTGGGRDDLAQAGLEFNGKISEITATVKDNISKIILNKGN